MMILETPRLVIRNWEDRDRDLFHTINSDEEVMRFFPFRRNRQESDEFFDRLRTMISETGLGFYALEEKTSGECIGFAGLLRTNLEPHLPDGTVEIGWRLARPFWGKGFVTEAGKALLAYLRLYPSPWRLMTAPRASCSASAWCAMPQAISIIRAYRTKHLT
jgi:RimJ/RimL family protein N-acetyltransferase